MVENEHINSRNARVELMTCARIPTDAGEFQLCHYRNNLDGKEHLALTIGEIRGKEDVLVRVHSECFTGDVLGSLRCDCGPQLQSSMRLIAAEKQGVIVYLRQEGRNIGLLDKLRAYNLQDAGYDTVDANLMLGHQADSREYSIAALILKDLGVSSIRILTNNPHKIESIEEQGVKVSARIPLQLDANQENLNYLITKAQKMRHMLDLDLLTIPNDRAAQDRPFVTLSYAQSLDGSIAARSGEQLILSGAESLMMTHRLRADHDAILVGIGTVLGDDPRLTVRLVEGDNPQPIVLDSRLRFPLSAKLLKGPNAPWIVTGFSADSERQRTLEAAGARVIRMPVDGYGRVDLGPFLYFLNEEGIRSLMVEGGAAVITSFLVEGVVDRLALTIAPDLVAGIPAVERARLNGNSSLPRLHRPYFRQLGDDIVVISELLPKKKGAPI
jgi:GTP cyclohydrolase II